MDGATMEERFGDFDRRLGRVEQGLATLGAQVEGLDARVGGLDARVGGLDARVSDLDKRMIRVEAKIDGLPDKAFFWQTIFTVNAGLFALVGLTAVVFNLIGRT